MIGFGSLALIASFPSIQMIGAVLFVGIGACLATSLILLPALLGLGRNSAEGKTVVAEGNTIQGGTR
jgi:predicted RND superfamily exporter protein